MSTVAPSTSSRPTPLPAIDRYEGGDDAAIVACIRAAFGAPARLERWRHLHVANPAGPSVIVVARDEDAIVGQIANVRRRLRFFGREYVVAHALDTAVHPTWQHRGIFPPLAAAATRELEREGLHVAYGVANETARHVAVRYEHRRPLGAFPVLVRPLRPLASLTAMVGRRLQPRRNADVAECATSGPVAAPAGTDLVGVAGGAWTAPRFDARHSALFDEAGDLPPIAFVRDAASLAWRYQDDADGPYAQRDVERGAAVAATAIVRVIEAAGLRLVLVMEWHWRTGNEDAGRDLAHAVLQLARRIDAHGVVAMGGSGSAQRRVLSRLGFFALPPRAFPQRAFPGVDARPPFAGDDRWTRGSHWYFTWGDGFTL